jgi:hypothetical protein
MKKVPVGLALRDRLGENGVRDLDEYLHDHREAWRDDVVNAITERLDYRFKECATREEMIEAFSRVAQQLADTKVEILRWSFVFWIGEVATMAVLLSYMLK